MTDGEFESLARATTAQSTLVPSSFAEKAMASLLQLHGELMDEKERRVDLYRRLMEKEQAVAELKMYVRILEEKVGKKEPAEEPRRAAPAPAVAAATSSPQPQLSDPPRRPHAPPTPPRLRNSPPVAAVQANPGAPKAGWKVW